MHSTAGYHIKIVYIAFLSLRFVHAVVLVNISVFYGIHVIGPNINSIILLFGIHGVDLKASVGVMVFLPYFFL